MDSLSQLVLGAAVAEFTLGKKIGNKALLIGMLAGTLPDLDVAINPLLDTVSGLDQHRGFTHSISFWLLGSCGLAILSKKVFKLSLTIKEWFWMYFWVFSTHAILDCFTSWGTQIFWPFSKIRVAFKSIFIIDPLYTIPLLLSVILCFFITKNKRLRQYINVIGLVLSTGYLILTLGIKFHINSVFQETFNVHTPKVSRFETKPTAFNTILWSATAETDDSFYIGYYSLLDKNKNIELIEHKKNHELFTPYVTHKKLKTLLRITEGYYIGEVSENSILIHDLRFGQLFNWKTKTGPFVFTYKLAPLDDNTPVITQVDRNFSETNGLFKDLFQRVLGNK